MSVSLMMIVFAASPPSRPPRGSRSFVVKPQIGIPVTAPALTVPGLA